MAGTRALVREVLDTLGANRADLVGDDSGGTVVRAAGSDRLRPAGVRLVSRGSTSAFGAGRPADRAAVATR